MNLLKHIPNTVTLLNLISGFVAILINEPVISPLLILFASILDLADGLLAKLLNARSNLGEQLDSLADVVSFGVAPAFIYYHHLLDGNWYDYVVVSFFPAMGALRLAIFNVTKDQGNSFKGLPIPASGLLLTFLVFAYSGNTETGVSTLIFVIVPVLLGLLMVSGLRMMSFKEIGSKTKFEKALLVVLAVVSLFLFVLYNFAAISYMAVLYVVLSLIYMVFHKRE